MKIRFSFVVVCGCAGILVAFSSPTWAQEVIPGLKIVAKPGMSSNTQYLQLYLENTTDQAIELKDHLNPSWSPSKWFEFKVDGQDVHILSPAAYALRFLPEKKLIQPKAKLFFGTAILRNSSKKLEWGIIPVLDLQPGKHLIEISSKAAAKSARLELTILDKTMPPIGDAGIGKGKSPLLISLSQCLQARKALSIYVHLDNLGDQEFLYSHDGLEPPWHTAPWFDVAVDGKPYSPKVPPVQFEKKGGTLAIRPFAQGIRGEFLIPLAGFDADFYKKNSYYTPLLPLSAGKHVIRVIPSKRWHQAGIFPPAPASIEVEIK